ncbi:hypothetical protein JOB18_021699 [Solea senegalensis]|nr:hypothetical protein JOB18_021699 [Solea senegalensis]
MHFSSMASRPLELGKLQENMEAIKISFCNLLKAEQDYVTLIFHEDSPTEDQLKPLEGITLPVGDTAGEIMASVCTITNYLDDHLPKIIRHLTVHHQSLVNNVRAFSIQFKMAFEPTACDQHDVLKCHRHVTAQDTYQMKVIGLRMIYYTRKWVEGLLNTTVSCDLS